MRKCLSLIAVFIGLAGPVQAVETPAGPQSDRAAAAEAQAKADQELAAHCQKVVCRKVSRLVTLQMRDKTSFETNTRLVPYFDDNGALAIFPGETISLSYASDDTKLEHPVLSSVVDPAGPVDLPSSSGLTISFKFEQKTDGPDMMLVVTNSTKAKVKYDAVMFVPDASGVHAARTSACPLMPPQGGQPSFSGFEHWPHPIVMLLISNIRALEPSGSFNCV